MMNLLILLLLVTGYYIFSGLTWYAYAIVVNKQLLGSYYWKMDESHIGVCKYPKWMLSWLWWIVKRFKR